MRRVVISLSIVAFMLWMAAGSAFAASPHFIGTPTCTKSLGAGLACSGKAAGLGDLPSAAFLTADSETATYDCVNHGGNIAPGQPIVIQNVTGPVQAITPHDGNITFAPTIPPPTPPPAKTECPNGNWTVQITSLTFTNVVLHIQQPPGTDILTFSFGTIDP